jgi:hypothetical protein
MRIGLDTRWPTVEKSRRDRHFSEAHRNAGIAFGAYDVVVAGCI